jgi:hypothetical protein
MDEPELTINKRRFRYLIVRESVYLKVKDVLDWSNDSDPDNIYLAEEITNKVMQILTEEVEYR